MPYFWFAVNLPFLSDYPTTIPSTSNQRIDPFHWTSSKLLLDPFLGSVQATSWKKRRSKAGTNKRFFSSPKRPDPLWGSHSLLLNGYRGSFPGINWPGRHVHLQDLSSSKDKNKQQIRYVFARVIFVPRVFGAPKFLKDDFGFIFAPRISRTIVLFIYQ
jgi:hypothetical protein